MLYRNPKRTAVRCGHALHPSDQANSHKGRDGRSGTECSVCVAAANAASTPQPTDEYPPVVDKNVTWWERPGMLASDPDPSSDPVPPTSPPSQSVRRGKKPATPKGWFEMHEVINIHRAALAFAKAEAPRWETRYRIQVAVRDKHEIPAHYPIDMSLWDTPFSYTLAHNQYEKLQQRRRHHGRRKPRPPLGRSSLSHSESVDDFEAVEAADGPSEDERMRHTAKKVGAEVGYLYFVGTAGRDLLKDWTDDFVRSKHLLVRRPWILPTLPPLSLPARLPPPSEGPLSGMLDIGDSIELAEASQPNSSPEGVDEDDIFDQFLYVETLEDDEDDEDVTMGGT